MEKIFIKKLCLLTFTLMALSLSTKGEVIILMDQMVAIKTQGILIHPGKR